MINIDKYAYASRLKRIDPMEKLTFAFLTMGVCLWANLIPISIVILLMMTWITVREGGTPLSLFLKLIRIPMAFLVIGVITIAFGISNNAHDFILSMPVFHRYIGISKAGMLTATVLFFKALGTVSCLYYLSLTTPMVDILSALKKLKCPKLMVELMHLIYRFIFVLMETADTMYIAQNSRLGYSSLSAGYRSMGTLASTLFIRAYKRSDNLYTALEARGYDENLDVLEEPFEKHWTGYFVPIIITIFLVITTLLLRQYSGGFFL